MILKSIYVEVYKTDMYNIIAIMLYEHFNISCIIILAYSYKEIKFKIYNYSSDLIKN